MNLINPKSLAVTLDAVNEVFFFGRSFYILLFILVIAIGISYADDYEPEYFLKDYSYAPLLPSAPIMADAQKITKTVQGITFDSNYDNGSLFDVASAGMNTFICTLYTESGELGNRKYWFRFRMTGVAGRTITLNIDHSNNPRPMISFDSITWRRLTAAEAPNSTQIILTFGASTNFAELAFFYPLGYTETYSKVSALILAHPYGTITVIGQSYQGRDMLMVTATDTAVPNTGKKRIWMHSRAHAGEATGTWVMLGFLEKILEDSTTGQRLRQNYLFNIVPLQNCDGVYLGLTRWDSQGIDPEQQWGNPTRIQEVGNIKTQVDSFMAGANPITVSLNLHSTIGNYVDTFFWKHLYPSVTYTFETIEQNYIDALNDATPLFNNLSPQTSQLDSVKFIESYFWNNCGESVMALTHEGHYYTRITDSQYITNEDYQEIGRAMAVALPGYFNRPVPVELSMFTAD
ncbi:MAG: M14-type cytosolic carboxypeptidase [bacterium]|nr:M14-type cytosolic carboxypeptidase [bacterium]